MTTQSKIFYGVLVDAFAFATAADSQSLYAGPHLACDIISKRRDKGTLATKPSGSKSRNAIKEVPREIWNKIKFYLIEPALKTTKTKLLRKLFRNCSVIQNMKDEGMIYRGPLNYCIQAEDGEMEVCDNCLDSSYEFWSGYFSQARIKNINMLKKKHGIHILCKDFLGDQMFEHAILALTLSHKDLPAAKSFKLNEDTSYEHTATSPAAEEIPVVFPNPSLDKTIIENRFKSFVRTYQLQGVNPRQFFLPFENSYSGGEKEKNQNPEEPKWIKWEVDYSK